MSTILDEQQTLMRDSVRDYLAAQAPVAQLRKLRDARDADGFSRPLWAGFAEMGYTGIAVPEAHGGLGLGCVEIGTVMEAIGRNLVAIPFLSTAVLAATAIAAAGDERQRAAWLAPIAAGERVATLAVDESRKHRPEKLGLVARATDGGFTLSGSKTFVVDGHVADLIVVAAGGEAGPSLFAVDARTPGLAIERTLMVDAHNAARLRFEDVRVGREALLGAAGGAREALERTLDVGRAALAAELLGIADEAFARTLEYLKQRQQFGRTIGEFQALQHRAAHLYSEIEVTRAAVAGALRALDAGRPAAAEVSVAKARAGGTATLAVQEAVQMHGGIGMTDELDIGLFMKRARVADELLGDAGFHADRLARINGY